MSIDACAADQQRAKGKPLLRVVTLSKPFIFELESVEDVHALVETLDKLRPKAAATAAAPQQQRGPDPHSELKAQLLKRDSCASLLSWSMAFASSIQFL